MKALFVALAAGAGLAGCAAPIAVGDSREADVRTSLGTPAEERGLADGSRVLDYPRAPLGHQNWRVTLGPDGRVSAIEQLLNEDNFARLQPGMTRAEVQQRLGRHGERMAFARLEEEVLSWRYLEHLNRPMFFNAHFDQDGRLKYTSRSEDFVPRQRVRSVRR
jgi:hypothetical protein